MVGSLILGFFDGIHAAHREVICSAVNYSDGRKTVLVTLQESPSLYFNNKVEYIMPRENSIKIIKSLGVNEVLALDFSKYAKMSAENYLKFLVEKYSPAAIFTGYNHTFGFNKKGDSKFLQEHALEYGYEYFCISEQKYGDKVISSTNIRELLVSGEIEDANRLLQSKFYIEGTVIKGAQLGRKIGFPTANIMYPEKIVKIPYGVYKVSVELDKEYTAIMNWGIKPTVNNTVEPVAEVHLLGFDGDLYGKNIKVELVKRIRGERKFENLEELRIQIKKDLMAC